MDENELNFTIKRGITDNAKRKLILNRKFIQFESNDLAINLNTPLGYADRRTPSCGTAYICRLHKISKFEQSSL